MEKSNLFELKASKKQVGDLITHVSTENGDLVVIIDKNNPNFVDAAAGEIWQLKIRTKEGASFGLGDLVRKVELESKIEHLVDSKTFPVGIVFRDKATQQVLLYIPLDHGVHLEGIAIAMVKNHIRNAKLQSFTAQILEEVNEAMKWYNGQFDKCYEVVKDAITLIGEAPRPDMFKEDFDVENLTLAQIEQEVWQLVNPFEIPNAEDVADQVILKLSCWKASNGQYKRINFV